MMDIHKKNDLIISLINASHSIVWDNERYLHAVLKQPQNSIDLIKSAYDHCVTELFLNGSSINPNLVPFNPTNSSRVEYGLELPQSNEQFALVRNFNSLFRLPIFYTTQPKQFYAIENKSSELPVSYLDTIKFCTLLMQIADHVENNSGEKKCFFYQGAKIAIQIKYTEKELRELKGIDNFVCDIEFGKPHLQERTNILKEIIIENTLGEPEGRAFSTLLSRFDRIKQCFEQNWSLFLNDFSLDKILDELESKTLALADNLATSLSELQKTMITIPLAVIFVAPQIDQTGLSSWKNMLILLGIWIFHVFTLAFFGGHKRSVRFIEGELIALQAKVKEKHPDLAGRVNQKFSVLQKRCDYQKKYRCIIGSLMWAMVIILTIVISLPEVLGKLFYWLRL